MKLFTIITAIILTTSIVSGQKCKYLTNKVSGMDNSRLVITQAQRFSGNKLDVWAKLHQDSNIVLALVLKEHFPLRVFKDASIILGENNQELITLHVLQDASRPLNANKSLTIYALISKEEFQVIEEKNINLIKVQTEDGWIDYEAASKKERLSVNRVLGCIAVML